MNAQDIMTTEVITVTPDHSIKHAARIMAQRGISAVPVTGNDGELVGILTEGDLLRRVELGSEGAPIASGTTQPSGALSSYVKSHSWRIGDVMTSSVIAVTEKTPVSAIAALMLARNIKRVPVVRSGKLTGIVARQDLLRCLAATSTEETIRGDAALAVAIRARLLEQANILSAVPEVTVTDGVVLLSGSLTSGAERQVVKVVVEGIQGINGVVDHMEVPHKQPPL